MTASTIGTSWRLPEDSENELTVHVFPVLSKITLFLPMTTMLAWESSSVLDCVEDLSDEPLAVAATKKDNRATNPSWPEEIQSLFSFELSRATIFIMVRTTDS